MSFVYRPLDATLGPGLKLVVLISVLLCGSFVFFFLFPCIVFKSEEKLFWTSHTFKLFIYGIYAECITMDFITLLVQPRFNWMIW